MGAFFDSLINIAQFFCLDRGRLTGIDPAPSTTYKALCIVFFFSMVLSDIFISDLIRVSTLFGNLPYALTCPFKT